MFIDNSPRCSQRGSLSSPSRDSFKASPPEKITLKDTGPVLSPNSPRSSLQFLTVDSKTDTREGNIPSGSDGKLSPPVISKTYPFAFIQDRSCVRSRRASQFLPKYDGKLIDLANASIRSSSELIPLASTEKKAKSIASAASLMDSKSKTVVETK